MIQSIEKRKTITLKCFLEESKYAAKEKKRLSFLQTTYRFLLMILIIFLQKYKKLFRFGAIRFYSPNYKKFCFLGSAISLLKYQRKTSEFFKLGARIFHLPKYKKNLFLRKYNKFFQSGFSFFLFLIFRDWTRKCAR